MRKLLVQIPNILTIIRILLIPIIIYQTQAGRHNLALAIFGVAALTDALDGFIAKLFKITSQFGTYLDPIADKLLLDSTYAVLAILGRLPYWLAGLIWLRDLIIVLGAIGLKTTNRPLNIKPALVGKATTLAQIITVCLFFDVAAIQRLSAWQPGLITATAILTIWSGGHYVAVGLQILHNRNNV